jgi:hypothetical protein
MNPRGEEVVAAIADAAADVRRMVERIGGDRGQTGYSHRIFQAGELQETFRLPLVLEIILK